MSTLDEKYEGERKLHKSNDQPQIHGTVTYSFSYFIDDSIGPNFINIVSRYDLETNSTIVFYISNSLNTVE